MVCDALPGWGNSPGSKGVHLVDHCVSSLLGDGLIYSTLPEA